MNPTINRLTLIFLGVFAVGVIGVVVWTVGWAIPAKRCESAHHWWDHGRRARGRR